MGLSGFINEDIARAIERDRQHPFSPEIGPGKPRARVSVFELGTVGQASARA